MNIILEWNIYLLNYAIKVVSKYYENKIFHFKIINAKKNRVHLKISQKLQKLF